METIDSKLVVDAIDALLRELLVEPTHGASWVLNPTDRALLDTLEGLSAEEASRSLIPNRSTVAGHADHLRYSLSLTNIWARGENPFTEADWAGSWRNQQVDEAKWKSILGELRAEAEGWRAAVAKPREWDPISLTGTIASPAHIAYHLGAIRQLLGHFESRKG